MALQREEFSRLLLCPGKFSLQPFLPISDPSGKRSTERGLTGCGAEGASGIVRGRQRFSEAAYWRARCYEKLAIGCVSPCVSGRSDSIVSTS